MMIMFRSNRSQMFFKIVVLKNLAIFTGKHLCWCFFFNKVLSCEICETFKNMCFEKHLRTTAFVKAIIPFLFPSNTGVFQ